jgi:DNA-binding beta-propeller fold protein YncE
MARKKESVMSTPITHRPNTRRVVLPTAAPLIAVLGLVAGFAPAAHAQTLYVANESPNTIEEFTSGGVGSVFASTDFGLFGLAFDSSGNLYAANFINNTIEKFTSGGTASVFAGTGLNDPEFLAFDSSGNLYVANGAGDTIEKFTSGGVASVFASTGLNRPSGLAFAPAGGASAPEPSALLLLAPGVLGLFATRRRKRDARAAV